jgi:ADP-ribose pyrophosphatase YjhB (NUDIX family)
MPLKLSVAVGGFLFIDNKLLIVKRSLHETGDPGIWEQPGGQVEEGEDPEQAVIRELKEENEDINNLKLTKDHDEWKFVTKDEFTAIEPTLEHIQTSGKKAFELQNG